jgi:hypothetical protein
MRPSSVARRLAFIVVALLLGTVEAQAQSVTLAWDRNPEANIAGYTVYVGVNPGTYSSTYDVNGAANTTFTFTQAIPGTRYYFSVAAYNTENITGPRSAEVSWKINVGPNLTQPANQAGAVASPDSLQLAATDDGDPLTYSATGLPAGLNLNTSTGLISGTPSAEGVFTVDVSVSDGSLSSSRTFTWTIGPRLSVTALTSNLASPQVTGTSIVFTAVATGGVAPYSYKFSVSSNGGSSWSVAQNWGAGATFTWVPTSAGTNYRIRVDARSAGVTADVAEGTSTVSYVVNPGPLNVTSLTSNRTSPQVVGTAITFTAAATGGTSPYQFKFLLTPSGGSATTLRDWNTSASYTWTPTTPGANSTITVWARSAGATADAAESLRTISFTITPAPLQVTSLSSNLASPQPVNTTITFTASSTGGTPPHQFKYWITANGTTWSVLREWSTSASYTWTPTQASPSYQIVVWARSAGATADAYESYFARTFAITAGQQTTPMTVTGLASNLSSPQTTGTAITLTASGSGGTAPYQYKYWVFDGATWTVLREWGSASYTWTPTVPNANYLITVWGRSAGVTADTYEGYASRNFTITGVQTPPMTVTGLTSNLASPQTTGTAITFTASGSGGATPYQYKYWVFDGATWTVLREWGAASYTWTPTVPNANYQITVWGRSAGVTADTYQGYASRTFTITGVQTAPLTVTNITTSLSSPRPINTAITLTAVASGGATPHQYKWWVSPNNGASWSLLRDWGGASFTWTPTQAANYQLVVWARSAGATNDVAEGYFARSFEITGPTVPPLTVTNLTSNLSSPRSVGTAITFTAAVSGGTAPHQFKYWVTNGSTWTVLREWSTSASYTWTPTVPNDNYQIVVWARSAGNSADTYEAYGQRTFSITSNTSAPLTLSGINMSSATLRVGNAVTMTVSASGGTSPYQFKWWVSANGGATWTVMKEWGSGAFHVWTPSQSGNYQVVVWGRSAGSTADVAEAYTLRAATVLP